ncbi:MAG: GyrI-like domain-containing protein [Candidatus Aminicenantia bacterium]
MKKILLIFLSLLIIFLMVVFSWEKEKSEASQEKSIAVKETTPFRYCALFHKGPFTEIENVVAQLIGEVQAQNIIPQGPMIGIYYNSPEEVAPKELQWEFGFPVGEGTLVKSPLELKEWNFTLVVSALHIGPYEESAKIYPQIFEWMKANNYSIIGPIIERYLDQDPSKVKPEELRTEVWIPCQRIEK